jgi:hypothetical protein
MYNSLEVASKAYIKNENEKIFLKLFVFAVYFLLYRFRIISKFMI